MEKLKNVEKTDKQITHEKEKRSPNVFVWGAVGGAAILGAALLYSSLPDIVRYIKITRM